MKPEVSVVIPVYNGSAYIKKALDSVLLQDIAVEIIVVDDGSEDGLDDVLAGFVKELSNSRQYDVVFRQIINSTRSGVAASRNRGVRAASADHIAFLDCDDWWEKDKLKRQLKLIEKNGCVLCCTGRMLVKPSGQISGHIIGVPGDITYRDLLKGNVISCSSVLIKRDVALEFPMEHDEYHEDYLCWLRILRKYGKACGINDPLLYYRLSASGKSGNKLRSAYSTFMVYRCMGFSLIKSLACFFGYMKNGFKKYTWGDPSRKA